MLKNLSYLQSVAFVSYIFLLQPMLYRILINIPYEGIYSLLRRNIEENPFQVSGQLLLKPLVY